MFSRKASRITAIIVVTVLLVFTAVYLSIPSLQTDPNTLSSLESLDSPSKAARDAYFFNMLRNPETNQIPSNVRAKELEHAALIYQETRYLSKKRAFSWIQAGPFDVGGRTRALAIDLQNSNRILAGGVSGGLWESTDRGSSWRPIELNAGNLSVTYIAQDPRPGEQNIWYYSSGEFIGNSASDPSRIAPYFGSGIYKSTDGGDSWSLLPAATPRDLNDFDSPFDFVNRIAVSPTTGTLFVASNAVGIYRSDDGGQSFGSSNGQAFPDPVLGGVNEHFWADVAVNENGIVLATLSETASQGNNNPGVFLSTNDGQTWQNVTPASFPGDHGRSVIAFAPSNPDVAYIFTTTQLRRNGREDVRLHRINVATRESINLSDNLPIISEAGDIDTQGGYNMAIAVKPDDENFVVLGATNLYRSFNGFTSRISDRQEVWVGGYDAIDDDFGNYENHHPDQHLLIFDPTNPSELWTANDGGVYRTSDVKRASELIWFDMNQGYSTAQFYTVAMPAGADDFRIAGGTQDNGTPFIHLDDLSSNSRNISVGDGAHLHFGDRFAYVGFQNGATLRLQYNQEDTPTFGGFSFIQPSAATNQLFINPFVVDPNNEDIMYYPAGLSLWRNNELTTLPSGQTENTGLDQGWTQMAGIPSLGASLITALAISQNPANILYYASSDSRENNPSIPRIVRVENANEGNGGDAVTRIIPGIPGGGYVSDIALNPNDADELLVVLSNYELPSGGLYHSTNGGESFTPVAGNLQGTNNTGPSFRSASILPTSTGFVYLLGTSTGLYSTTALTGTSTTWTPEGSEEIGQAVVWDVFSRPSDEVIAVGTHGRGLYLGSADPNFNPRPSPDIFALSPNYPNPFASTTRIPFTLLERSTVNLSVFDLSGRKVADLITNQEMETGRHETVFNAASVTSGVYLFQILIDPVSATSGTASFSQSGKMMVIK